MLSRCYNTKNKNYNQYGGIGVRVDPRWYCFENFVEDVKTLPGYDKFLGNPDIYQLDKDYLQQNIPHSQRVYSKNTCIWISKYDNIYLQSIEDERNIDPNQCNYVGVFKKGPHSYNSKIKINGKNYYIGTFSNSIAAANAYNYFYNKYNRNEVINAVNNVPYMPPEEFIKYNNNVKQMVKVVNKVQRLSSEET